MMKVFLIVVLVIVGLFFVKLVVARRKFTKRWKQEEEYALQISRCNPCVPSMLSTKPFAVSHAESTAKLTFDKSILDIS
jgi:hypothetical protein